MDVQQGESLSVRGWPGAIGFGQRAFARAEEIADERALLAVATLVAALVRLPTLGAKSLWYDELISVSIARHPVSEILRARLRIDASEDLIDHLFTNNPPLHLLIIHFVRLISTSDAAMRLPFALAGVASVPVAYAVLRRLLGMPAAAIGSFLFAVSPLHIAYSQEARPTALLVLFSLAGLLALLKAVEGERRLDWVWFVVFGLLNVWSSYFAAVAVLPTFAVIWVILLVSRRRRQPDTPLGPLVRPTLWSGAVIAVGCAPLASDFLAVARMNNAAATPSASILVSLATSWWIVAQLANPIPTERLPSMLAAGLVASGLLAVVRLRTREIAVALAWVAVPCLLLTSIKSSHVLNVRYVLASLPVVVALAACGNEGLVPPPLRRAAPRLAQGLGFALLGLLFLSSALGVRAYQDLAIWTGPIKPDWRGVVSAFSRSAGADSCLVTVSGIANGISGVVPYYLENSKTSRCAIGARDPRVLDVAANHPDLWFAFGTRWYYPNQVAALTDAMKREGEIETFDFVLLLHPWDRTIGAHPGAIDALLRKALAAAEPAECRNSILAPAIRESLANIAILQDRDPAEAVALVVGFEPPMGDNDELMWDRAYRRLAWGDVDGARIIAVRLVGLYPGNSRAYVLLAEIDRAASDDRWTSYEQFAQALAAAQPPLVDEHLSAQCDHRSEPLAPTGNEDGET
jgi:mannosyltransferase